MLVSPRVIYGTLRPLPPCTFHVIPPPLVGVSRTAVSTSHNRRQPDHHSHNGNKSFASYFYDNPPIDEAAKKPSVRLTPQTILYSGKFADGKHLLRSAKYLHKELPVRIAHRIDGFRSLPFIVGCNPNIQAVHDLYIRAFYALEEYPEIGTVEESKLFSNLLRELLDDHTDVVSLLAKGFRESTRYLQDDKMVEGFLDRTLTSRLGIRMLAMHHLALHHEQPEHVGIINKSMRFQDVISRWCDFTSTLCLDRYGKAPAFKLSGHINAAVPYIQAPLDYIIPEILKNAARATVESHMEKERDLPSIYITVAVNDYDFVIRFSDRGGGIPHHLRSQVLRYNYTTVPQVAASDGYGMQSVQGSLRPSGAMHGYGFGLPTSKAYAAYLGGRLQLTSLGGIGTDVYLTLPHIDGKAPNPFRI